MKLKFDMMIPPKVSTYNNERFLEMTAPGRVFGEAGLDKSRYIRVDRGINQLNENTIIAVDLLHGTQHSKKFFTSVGPLVLFPYAELTNITNHV